MKYTVIRIDEDIDFRCEERKEGNPVMAVLILQDENGNEMSMRYPDKLLYELDVQEGDDVILDEEQKLVKRYSWNSDKDADACQHSTCTRKKMSGSSNINDSNNIFS